MIPGIYRHYKGKFYAVIGLVRHSETGELMVLYIPLYLVNEDTVPTQLTVRPFKNFIEVVNLNGQKHRFERVHF